MAGQQPENPNIKNPFDKFAKSLSDFLKSSETKDKIRDARMEKLIKEMTIQYKLLEKAYNKGNISAKSGKMEDLNNDKGFLQLIELMTDIDDSFRDVINKYIKGGKLVKSEKLDLAKFVDRMQQSLKETKEMVGVPLEDLIDNFKELLKDGKASQEFQIDLLRFLKDYSEEDIALTEDLKTLIGEVLKTNKLTDENIIKIEQELDKTFDGYIKGQSTTFAPFLKMGKDLKEANLALEDIVSLLTQTQRQKEDKKEGFQEKIGKDFTQSISGLAGSAMTGITRATAVSMSRIPALKPVAPFLAGAGSMIGGATSTYLSTRGLVGAGKDALSLGKGAMSVGGKVLSAGGRAIGTGSELAPKAMPFLRGAGAGLSKLALPATLLMGVYGAVKGAIQTKGNAWDKAGGAGMGVMKTLSGGLITEKRLSDALMPVSVGIAKGYIGLSQFMGDQNKKIFGNNLDLGQVLFKNIMQPLTNLFPKLPTAEQVTSKSTYTGAGESAGKAIGGMFGKEKGEQGAKIGKSIGAGVYDIGKALYNKGREVWEGANKVTYMGTSADKSQSARFGGNKAEQIGRGTLAGMLSQNKDFESLAGKHKWYNAGQFQNDIAFGRKGTASVMDELSKTAGFQVSGAMGTASSVHKGGRGQGKGHYSGTKFDLIPTGKETMESLYKKAVASGRFSEVRKEGSHIDVQIKKAIYDKVKNESEIASKSDKLSPLPKKQPKEQAVAVKPSTGKMMANAPSKQKSDRKLKSSNEMLNMYNVHGVLG